MAICAEDKQACLHSNSCNMHAYLRDTPISELFFEKIAKSDN